RDTPQPFATQARHPHRALDDGDAAGGGVGRAPLLDRVDEAGLARASLGLGPAVVLAGADEVQLVPCVLADLARPQPLLGVPGDALHVAVAVGVEDRVTLRVALTGRFAVGRHAEDLAAQGLLVLREPALAGLSRAGVEHLVGAERDASAVVDLALGDALE